MNERCLRKTLGVAGFVVLIVSLIAPNYAWAGQQGEVIVVEPQEAQVWEAPNIDLAPGTAVVIVGDYAVPALKGVVIPAAGGKHNDGSCPEIAYRVVARGSATSRVDDVIVSIDEDCNLVVEDVVVIHEDQQSENMQSSRMAATTMRGYARALFEEQFFIDVSWVRSQVDYHDSGTAVYNGHNPYFACWSRAATGWTTLTCGPAF